MGLLGDLAGALAGAALEGIGNKIQQGITNASLEDSDEVGILFDHDHYGALSDSETRTNFVQMLLAHIGNGIGLTVNENNFGKDWIPYIENSYDGECWDAFVLKNDFVTVRYGLYGRAECALLISGSSAGGYARKIAAILEELEFDNVRFCFEEIPFHEADWMDAAEEKLRSPKKVKKSPPKISGDKKTAEILLKKIDEILSRAPAELFDIDSLQVSNTESSHIFSDGNTSIEYSDLPNIEEFVYLIYQKNHKSLLFSFGTNDPYGASLTVSLTDADNKETKFEVTYIGEGYNLLNALDCLEKKNIAVPSNFYDDLVNFIFEKTTQILKIKVNSQNSNDDFADYDDDTISSDEVQAALEILELSGEDISVAEIKNAYRRLAKEFHPDMMQGLTPKMKKIAESKMQELKDAYELLLENFDDEE